MFDLAIAKMHFPEPAEPATPSGLVTSENNRGHWLNLAMIIFLTWSVLFYCVRVWAKIRVKTMGSDDVVVTCALVSGPSGVFFFSFLFSFLFVFAIQRG